MEDIEKNSRAGLTQSREQESADRDETAYLLHSPKNAERLLAALNQAELESGSAESIEGLRRSVGLESASIRKS